MKRKSPPRTTGKYKSRDELVRYIQRKMKRQQTKPTYRSFGKKYGLNERTISRIINAPARSFNKHIPSHQKKLEIRREWRRAIKKRTVINDIAKHCEISIATAWRIINKIKKEENK